MSFMTIFWAVLFFLLLFIEIITVNLVSIWFAIGALVATFITFFTDNVFIQLIVFIIISIISLLLTKSIVKKVRTREIIPTNLDRVIGKKAIVTKKIGPNSYGEVKIFGTLWTAASNLKFDIGDEVLVKKIDGVKLIVTKEGEK